MPAGLSFLPGRYQQACTGDEPVQALKKTFARKVFKKWKRIQFGKGVRDLLNTGETPGKKPLR
jgi:hypothetical protein